MATALSRTIPSHVPPELIMTLPLFARTTVAECPQETIIPQMQVDLPSICYVTNIFPGDQPGWLLKHAEDVQIILRDSENFTKKGMGKFAQSIGDDWLIIPTEADPPLHTGYRATLNPYFSGQKMFALKDQIRSRADDLIETFESDGSCDFISQFSAKFPINIVLDLLGLPADRMPQFLEWEGDMLHSNDWDVRTAAVRNVKNYLLEEIESRRVSPRDDYITSVLGFSSFGRPWTEEEVLGHCFNLYLGGLDTVTSMLGNIFNYLASHPDQQEELRQTPSKIVLAVEEFLRAFAPLTVFRIATKEIEIRGQRIMPGDYVAVSTSLVGYDPAAYDNPKEVRFDRKAPHIALGGGIHKCMGMHLARLEMQVAIEEFLIRLPAFRIKSDVPPEHFVGNILHMARLHLEWG